MTCAEGSRFVVNPDEGRSDGLSDATNLPYTTDTLPWTIGHMPLHGQTTTRPESGAIHRRTRVLGTLSELPASCQSASASCHSVAHRFADRGACLMRALVW